MKIIEWWQRLETVSKVLLVLGAIPLVILVIGPLVSIFTLPLIGYFIGLNSWRGERRSKDKWVYAGFVASLTGVLAILLVFQNPALRTDWEGGNPLDDLIALLLLTQLALFAVFWSLLGWVIQRAVVRTRG